MPVLSTWVGLGSPSLFLQVKGLVITVGRGNIETAHVGPAVIAMKLPKETRLRSHTPFHLLKAIRLVVAPQKAGDQEYLKPIKGQSRCSER